MNDEAKLRTAVGLAGAGKLDKALPLFKDLALRHKNVAVVQYNYGNALRMSGRLSEAVRYYSAAVAIDPGYVDASLNLAVAYCELGEINEALTLARGVLAREPANPVAAIVLNLAADLGFFDESAKAILAQVVTALEAGKNSSKANNSARVAYALGIAYTVLGRRADAIVALRQAAEHPETAAHAIGRLLAAQDELCLWTDRKRLGEALTATARAHPSAVGAFGFLKFDTPELACTVAAANAPKVKGAIFRHQRRNGERLRIGYFSPDFRRHAVASLMAEVVELHDRKAFDVQLFSCGPDDGSDMRRRLIESADGFTDVRNLSARDAAQKINSARVDILVDLAAFTKHGRMDVMACRPANIQVNWLGYPGTSGAPYIDYIIGDHVTIPAGSEGCFSEAVVKLPVTYLPNDRKRAASPAKSRAEYGLPPNGRILAAFHQSWKIQPQVFDVWCHLLRRHPDTILWFINLPAATQENLVREAGERDIERSRLVFGDFLPANEHHLARYQVADLLLDVFPYGGHTTVSDALWQSCPVVTMAGRSFQARVGASLLAAAGFNSLITTSLDDYVELLDRLLADPKALPRLRAELQTGAKRVQLFDTPRFVHELEFAYRAMAERARKGLPPQAFDVPLGGGFAPS